MAKTFNNAKGAMIFAAVFGSLFLAAVLLGLFVWYARTVIPHTYPTPYTNFFWGFVHAIFLIPTLVWSIFAHTITIYQAPNVGGWYNVGYFLGLSIILGGSHGTRNANKRKVKKFSA